jgi:methanogenic corrinoid protein MtbC1
MSKTNAEIGQRLDSSRAALADAVVSRHYEIHPDLEKRYGSHGRKKCREDAAYHLTYLSEALTNSRPALFREYIAWARIMLEGRNIPVGDLANNLSVIAQVIKEHLPREEAATASAYVEAAIADLPEMPGVPPSCIATSQKLSQLAQSYLAALLAGKRNEASTMILEAVRSGTSIKDVYIHIFQQTQYEIGRLWQTNQITVAHEHYCTAVTQMIMSQLYPQIFAAPRIGRRFVGSCIGGDLHEIGIRMVADFFEMEGWDTVYLGASVPGPDLIKSLQEHKPDVVGISATIAPHISAVTRLISAIRSTPDCSKIQILVGGYPFPAVPDLWEEVKADGCALDAQGAVNLANEWMRNN